MTASKHWLLELIVDTATRRGLHLKGDQIVELINQGRFIILLDGLDEIEESARRRVVLEIASIAANAPSAMILVSSRPDESCTNLSEFSTFTVHPLSLDKAEKLIELIPFDTEIKAKFIAELRHSLYREHDSFLSNPLLLSIMLLTYGQSASIPGKLSIFYNQAYEALYQTHDAYKGGFSRKRHVDLDIRDFERLFAMFCLLTYDERVIRFSRSHAVASFAKVIPALQLSVRNGQSISSAIWVRDIIPFWDNCIV